MRRIFTLFISFGCLMAISQKSFSQTLNVLTNPQCNAITSYSENIDFQTGSTTNMNGFSGAGWTKVISGNNEYLQVTTVASTTYDLVTPTYTTSSGTLNLKFSIGGNVNLSSYSIFYQTTAGGPLTLIGTVSGNSSGVQCLSITGWTITQRFRFVIQFTTASGGSGSGNLTFDDWFLTPVIGAIVLPVKISTLEARSVNGSTSLTWNVAAEDNVSGYDVEKSLDGRSFSKIAFVPATGAGSYTFVDAKPLETTTYYRVKSVDADGKFSYSSIASMRKGGKSTIVLRAFPMPAIKDITIQHATATKGSLLSISSEDGRVIKSIVPASGTQQTVIDLSSAKAGLYIVRYSNANGEVESLKLIKQ